MTAAVLWHELAAHGVSAWDYFEAATEKVGFNYKEGVAKVAVRLGLVSAIATWRESV